MKLSGNRDMFFFWLGRNDMQHPNKYKEKEVRRGTQEKGY